ncbi:hypothetical protein [Conexibacter arvalis]|uniref:Universal stress protein n=1 Tax=Conexibacter arvalis TaxID=912552 RepID=A0A840IH72_9ACTN|nr:hypothetical protein [Conexibacter arvalis]MBB4663414.1 hypothetical protein [Conexibacter arvalis]
MAEVTRHVLVVAGRTALSDALRGALLARAAAGPAEFTLLLPGDGDACERARRLVDAVERLRGAGLDVAGQLGDADPLVAVTQAWDPGEFDEIVLATHPPGRSRWLARDLPGRIERATGVAVRRVVAEG